MRWIVSGLFHPIAPRSHRSTIFAIAAIVRPPEDGGGIECTV